MLLKSFFAHIFTVINDEAFQNNLEDVENRMELLDVLFNIDKTKIDDISFFNSSPPSLNNKEPSRNILSRNTDNDDEIVTNLLQSLKVELKGQEIVFTNIRNTLAKHAKEYHCEIVKTLSVDPNSPEAKKTLAYINEYSNKEKYTSYKSHIFRNTTVGLSMELFNFGQEEEINKEFDFVYDIENIKLFNLIEPVFYRLYSSLNLCNNKVKFYKQKITRKRITENKIHCFIRAFQRYLDMVNGEIFIERISEFKLISCITEIIKHANIPNLKQTREIFEGVHKLYIEFLNNSFRFFRNEEKFFFKTVFVQYALETLTFIEEISKLKTAINLKSKKECFIILSNVYDVLSYPEEDLENTIYLKRAMIVQTKITHLIGFSKDVYNTHVMKLLEKSLVLFEDFEFIPFFFEVLFTEKLFDEYETFFGVFLFLSDPDKTTVDYKPMESCLLAVFKMFLLQMKNKKEITNSVGYRNSYLRYLDQTLDIPQENEQMLAQITHLANLSKDVKFTYCKHKKETIITYVGCFLEDLERGWYSTDYYEICYGEEIFEFVTTVIKNEARFTPRFTRALKKECLNYLINKNLHTNSTINKDNHQKHFIVCLLLKEYLDSDSDTLYKILNFGFLSFEEYIRKLSKMMLDSQTIPFSKGKLNNNEKLMKFFLILTNLFKSYGEMFTENEILVYNGIFKKHLGSNYESFYKFIKTFHIINSHKVENVYYENVNLTCIPLINIFPEETIISYIVKNIKEGEGVSNITSFLQADVFIETINHYFKKKCGILNEDETYLWVFSCLIDEEKLNFDITVFIQKLDIEHWVEKLSVGNFKETLEGNKYKELEFFNDILYRFVFYVLLISETTKNLEYVEKNRSKLNSFTESLFCKFFDIVLSDVDFFQAVANISIGNKLICRIIKFYMNTSENKTKFFGDIVEKFYNVFIGGKSSIKYYEDAEPVVKNVLDYFHSFEYKY